MKAGSLFSGYGGLDCAVEKVFGAQVAWHAEIEPAPARILAHHWPHVPNLGDVTAIDWGQAEPVDLLLAGYPCQPFSAAGLRLGEADERYLWPQVVRAARVLGPRFIVLENVRGHLVRRFDRVLGDLTDLGYDVRWTVVRASDAGAPHRRERLFVIATNAERGGWDGRARTPRPRRWAEPTHRGADAPPDALYDRRQGGQERHGRAEGGQPTPLRADADGRLVWGQYAPAIRRWEHVLGRLAPAPTEPGTRGNRRLSPRFVEWLMGLPAGWVCDVPGLSRSEQLKALGNGVVPQQAELALRHLLAFTPAQHAPVEVPA